MDVVDTVHILIWSKWNNSRNHRQILEPICNLVSQFILIQHPLGTPIASIYVGEPTERSNGLVEHFLKTWRLCLAINAYPAAPSFHRLELMGPPNAPAHTGQMFPLGFSQTGDILCKNDTKQIVPMDQYMCPYPVRRTPWLDRLLHTSQTEFYQHQGKILADYLWLKGSETVKLKLAGPRI